MINYDTNLLFGALKIGVWILFVICYLAFDYSKANIAYKISKNVLILLPQNGGCSSVG